MLNKTDLTDAVGEGIITAEQADQLSAFSKRLRSGEDNLLEPELETRDEPVNSKNNQSFSRLP